MKRDRSPAMPVSPTAQPPATKPPVPELADQAAKPKAEKKPKGKGGKKPKEGRPDNGEGWKYRTDHTELRQADCPVFTQYYRDLQKVVPAGEWEAFMETMRTPLGTTIWINDCDPLADSVAARFKAMPEVMEPIPWYPIKDMGWRLKVDKRTFRKDPALQPLRQFLIRQTALGTTSRQEEVSMIPPFLLDLKPTDRCLDMCASPGSKTAQMLVGIGRQRKGTTTPFDYGEGAGYVVANEMDEKRANMLVHQCKRLRMLFPFAMFTNHDARFLPEPMDDKGEPCRFDKILLDVVCSGDGTLRKAPAMIGRWTPGLGNTQQRLQIQIAMRGCALLKVGGRMVYSTCSLNPIENEAVVAQVLTRSGGAMKLVDARSLLPGLECNPGFNTWAVTSHKGEVANAPGDHSMHEACFPPAEPLGLERCMRLLPKHCDGGGFFIAVLEKAADFEQPPPAEFVPKRKQDGTSPSPPRVPPCFVDAPDGAMAALATDYGLTAVPRHNVITRAPVGLTSVDSTAGPTVCSFVSDGVRRALVNPGKTIVVAAGLRILAPESLTKGYRLTNEACPLFERMLPATARAVRIHLDDLLPLMASPPLFEAKFEDIPNEDLRQSLEALPVGPIVLLIDGSSAGPGVACAALRARSRLQLLVDKEDMLGFTVRLGVAEHPTLQRLMGQPGTGGDE